MSAKSLANWVAKTHHLLGDELGLGVGDTALLALPAHWISVPIVLGCLTAGLALSAEARADAAVAFVSPATSAGADGVLDVYAVAPDSAAVGFRDDPPAPALDYVAAVRPQADAWAGVLMPAADTDPCLPELTRAETQAFAVRRARELDLEDGGRLLTTREWTSPADWVDAVLAPLAVSGSVVVVRNCEDPDVLARRVDQERATARLS